MNLRAHDLAVQFYKMARGKKLPFGLQGQLQRASSSVALNLAEGWGRATPADRRRFFQMALGGAEHREFGARSLRCQGMRRARPPGR